MLAALLCNQRRPGGGGQAGMGGGGGLGWRRRPGPGGRPPLPEDLPASEQDEQDMLDIVNVFTLMRRDRR